VYLPRVEEAATVVAAAPQLTRRGTETILLTEDDREVRALAHEALELSGYSMLEAATPADALRIAQEHSGVIHLLLTDVVMPGMNGRALADQMLAQRPNLKVLFMSGYPASAIGQHGILDPGTAFLQKPFTPGSLARKVGEVLDAGA